MRIAQVAPLFESVPPSGYGGTERVVAYLTDELLRRGHDVTLFASSDSQTRARLVPGFSTAVRLTPSVRDPLAHHLCMLDELLERADEFDVIHSHVDYLGFPFLNRCPTPSVTTLHGRLDLPDLKPVYRRFSHLPVVSISDAQRRPVAAANWQRTVHHGLPLDEVSFDPRGGEYLAFLGRIAREKRPDRAIEIAKRVGLPLKIAAKIDPADREYYEQEIRPLLDDPRIEFIGEISGEAKSRFLGGARAVLFPIDWPEPFGLVMIEAMAAGTPVIAFRCGSVPEVMEDGVSGFIVDDLDEAVDAVKRVSFVDRAGCRAYFESRFSVVTMAEAYLGVYRNIMALGQSAGSRVVDIDGGALAAS